MCTKYNVLSLSHPLRMLHHSMGELLLQTCIFVVHSQLTPSVPEALNPSIGIGALKLHITVRLRYIFIYTRIDVTGLSLLLLDYMSGG